MFFLPVVCLLLLTFVSPITTPFFALVAVVSMGVGVVMERWRFFAEAKHVVMLYYGQEAA
jgi:DMSO reductase anchor subunit